MRQRLGLSSDPQPRSPERHSDHHGQRHRFARDGEVPVTIINSAAPSQGASTRSRLVSLEESLAAERESHSRTKRALEDALAMVQALQTKLGHTELASDEALKAERGARAQAEMALQLLRDESQAVDEDRRRADAPAEQQPRPGSLAVRQAAAVKRPRKPRESNKQAEPEPVKWWLKSGRKRS